VVVEVVEVVEMVETRKLTRWFGEQLEEARKLRMVDQTFECISL
jgi:hypothetical protein